MNAQETKNRDTLVIETAVRTILREHSQYAPTFAKQDPDFASNVILITMADIIRIIGRNLHRTPGRNIPRIINDVLLYEEIVNVHGRWVFTPLDAIDYVFVKLPDNEVMRLSKRPNASIIGAHAETFSTDGLMVFAEPSIKATKEKKQSVSDSNTTELEISLYGPAGKEILNLDGKIVAAKMRPVVLGSPVALQVNGTTALTIGFVTVRQTAIEWKLDSNRQYTVVLTIEV